VLPFVKGTLLVAHSLLGSYWRRALFPLSGADEPRSCRHLPCANPPNRLEPKSNLPNVRTNYIKNPRSMFKSIRRRRFGRIERCLHLLWRTIGGIFFSKQKI